MPKAILYFGSFNPVHNGHIALAKAISEQEPEAEIWFVLSAQNPFKHQQELWPEETRSRLLKQAIEPFPRFRFCPAELELPVPSYTIRTLVHLQNRYPNYEFAILMGEDNLAGLHKWKNYTEILSLCRVFVYPRQNNGFPVRKDYQALLRFPDRIRLLENLPLLDISSTEIREKLHRGETVSHLVPWTL